MLWTGRSPPRGPIEGTTLPSAVAAGRQERADELNAGSLPNRHATRPPPTVSPSASSRNAHARDSRHRWSSGAPETSGASETGTHAHRERPDVDRRQPAHGGTDCPVAQHADPRQPRPFAPLSRRTPWPAQCGALRTPPRPPPPPRAPQRRAAPARGGLARATRRPNSPRCSPECRSPGPPRQGSG